MSSDKQYYFSFTTNGALNSFAHLILYNGYDEKVDERYGQIQKKVPKGLYRLRFELNEIIFERTYRVDKDIYEVYNIPGTYSAIPNKTLSSSHEYYSETSAQWSRSYTIPGEKRLGDSSIFLFFRYPNDKVSGATGNLNRSLGENFLLLGADRKVIYYLSENVIKEDRRFGWMAFHMPAANGIYYLVYKGKERREIPVYVFKGWQTQLFITFSEGPLFSTLRILLGRGEFDMNDYPSLQIDAILQKMHNGIFYTPADVVHMAADGKWENPMLGLVVSYAYLLSDSKEFDKLFKIIVGNLERSILNNNTAPDLVALRLLEAIHHGQKDFSFLAELPCMVLAGTKAVLRNTSEEGRRIKQGSVLEKIVQRLKFDCVWTSYEPLEYIDDDDHFYAPAVEKSIKEFRPVQDWITNSIFNQLAYCDPAVTTPNIDDIAKQFNLTPDIVRNHIREIPKIDSALYDFTDKHLKGTRINTDKVMQNLMQNLSILSKNM